MHPTPHPTLLDRNLVRRALCGEQSALDHLIERLECVEHHVHAAARAVDRAAPLTSTDLHRVVQDSLRTIWASLDTYAGQLPLERWATEIASARLHAAAATAAAPPP